MSLEVLMATYNSRLLENKKMLKKLGSVKHLVVDQSPQSSLNYPEGLNVLRLKGKGLTKSRNLALKNSTGEICLISDDDLDYIEDFENRIILAFDKNPQASVITFQVVTPDGSPYKKYRKKTFSHSKRTMISSSSVEIAFRRNDIVDNKIFFNENFGINAFFSCGEEAVFLNECKRNGLGVIHVPIYICVHPKESSGKDFSSPSLLLAKGAVVRKLYGPLGFFLLFIYILKNYKKIFTSKSSLGSLFRGYFIAEKISRD